MSKPAHIIHVLVSISLLVFLSGCRTAPLDRIGETGRFNQELSRRTAELQRLISASELAHDLGLKVNAGHGLNYQNLPSLFAVPHLVELNVGHSLVSRAVTVGLTAAVREMLVLMKAYSSV